MKIKHTFLLEEGFWVATGEYFDMHGAPAALEGTARITHGEGLWKSRGVMRLASSGGGGAPMEIENNYEIRPFEGRDHTGWTSMNPALGRLAGLFVIVDDTIVSTISSEDGQFSGIECLQKVTDYHYRTRGFIFKGDEKVSSWAADLVRRTEGMH
ncbi:MAG: hypothetical protein HS130_11465 [Deltaproteobacteria bacterium]|nr:hypothetical protein [Deltaproteobacteria bacterium]MCL4873423.1 hypothetical protein [bacterium]